MFLLIVLVLALLFIGANLDNRCNVSIGVYVWHDVPVFLSMLFSFVVGMLCMVPIMLRIRYSGRASAKTAEGENGKEDADGGSPPTRA
jgi:uncharacterized integral membrane protein